MHLTNWLRAPGTEELEHVFPTRLKSWLHNILIISHFLSTKTGSVEYDEYFGCQLEVHVRAATFASNLLTSKGWLAIAKLKPLSLFIFLF